MKTQWIAAGLMAATMASVVYYDELVAATRALKQPAPEATQPLTRPAPTDPAHAAVEAVSDSPRIDVVFALDTTGSMSGMINAAREKIWSIASSMAAAQVAPTIRVGLVAYRDRGDQYVTRTFDLTEDLDSMYTTLMQFRAAGGGDGPESVNQALHEAVTTMSWSPDPNAYKVVFLVGDAPGHSRYQDDVPFAESVRLARARGITVNTILCGNDGKARLQWQQIAGLSQGQYFRVGQEGSAVAVATPYDKKMSELARELDKTRLTYGSVAQRESVAAKRSRVDSLMHEASAASKARRAAFNASPSGRANLLTDKDLVADVAAGKVRLDDVAADHLPAALQDKTEAEQKAELARRAERRSALQQEIRALSERRQAFIRDELETRGSKDSLDDQIFATIRSQAAASGIEYDMALPKY